MQAFWNSGFSLSEDPMDGRSADQMGLRQLSQALPLLAVAEDGGTIENQRLPSDMPAF